MLASVIKQLWFRRPDTPQPVKKLGDYQGKGERPEMDAFKAALMATVQGFSSVYIVIDGLDECPALKGERRELLEFMQGLASSVPDNLHVFCTSRKETDIAATVAPILKPPTKNALDLNEHRRELDHGIGIYIDSELAKTEYQDWPEEIKGETRKALVQKAAGM
jgi:ankyrin repeat domain-containing protein 50